MLGFRTHLLFAAAAAALDTVAIPWVFLEATEGPDRRGPRIRSDSFCSIQLLWRLRQTADCDNQPQASWLQWLKSRDAITVCIYCWFLSGLSWSITTISSINGDRVPSMSKSQTRWCICFCLQASDARRLGGNIVSRNWVQVFFSPRGMRVPLRDVCVFFFSFKMCWLPHLWSRLDQQLDHLKVC